MSTPYTSEADLLADGYVKISNREAGGYAYERIGAGGIPIRHEFPSSVSTTTAAQAAERVRFERVSKSKSA